MQDRNLCDTGSVFKQTVLNMRNFARNIVMLSDDKLPELGKLPIVVLWIGQSLAYFQESTWHRMFVTENMIKLYCVISCLKDHLYDIAKQFMENAVCEAVTSELYLYIWKLNAPNILQTCLPCKQSVSLSSNICHRLGYTL